MPKLSIKQILAWADAHHGRTGRWPEAKDGAIIEASGELWSAVNAALASGGRGLKTQGSLARFLAKYRGKRNLKALPPLTKAQIFTWAREHRRRTGKWPKADSGPVHDAPGEVWKNVDGSLSKGLRGLPGGDSLPRLLARRRGVQLRAAGHLPTLSVGQILGWADAHHVRKGRWPTRNSGPITGALGETWGAVHKALSRGRRGLSNESSLAKLLQVHRGVPVGRVPPPLNIAQILQWADAHQVRTGEWPDSKSGAVAGAPGEVWRKINISLGAGCRGLPTGGSLARLLAEHRGRRNRRAPPPLTESRILQCARRHRKHTGNWPTVQSGSVLDLPDETWGSIHHALRAGRRGVYCGLSLAQFLSKRVGKKLPRRRPPPLTQATILQWAQAHRAKLGRWPNVHSGTVLGQPEENWSAINSALDQGLRGLPGGDSVARLLARAEAGVV